MILPTGEHQDPFFRLAIETWAPGVRANSWAKEEVCTRNSCMASTDTRESVPPKALVVGRAPGCPETSRKMK